MGRTPTHPPPGHVDALPSPSFNMLWFPLRAMNVTWRLLTALSVVCHAEARCSPTSYYKNCWIRRFPGVFIDIGESQRRGAQLLKYYQEESALKCSRTCCLTRNFSCNLAIFHYDATQENANCLHLHCPALESCILGHRGNVVLYNITKGVDPDLLVFGKYFTSNVRVLPHHYGRSNASEPLPSDKRQFIHPPPPPPVPPLTPAPALKSPIAVLNATAAPPLQSTRQSTALPTATTAPTSTSADPPTVAEHYAQTTPATSTFSTPSFNQPLLSPTATTQTTSAFSTTPAPPSSTATLHYTTFSQSDTSPPTSPERSKQSPSDPKDEGVSGEDTSEGSGPGWHAAAHSLLIAVAVCVTVLLSCCCSILLFVSWRGQRKRMGRYQTSWRGKKGSMRLIKYVLVRESS